MAHLWPECGWREGAEPTVERTWVWADKTRVEAHAWSPRPGSAVWPCRDLVEGSASLSFSASTARTTVVLQTPARQPCLLDTMLTPGRPASLPAQAAKSSSHLCYRAARTQAQEEGPSPKAVPGSDGEGVSGIKGDSGPAGPGKRCLRRLVFTPPCAGRHLLKGAAAGLGGQEPFACISFPELSGDHMYKCLWRCRGFYPSQSASQILVSSIIVGKWLLKLQVLHQTSPWGFPASFRAHCAAGRGLAALLGGGGAQGQGATNPVSCLHPWARVPAPSCCPQSLS